MFKSDRRAFETELSTRGITRLIHFTTEQNLPIIMEAGSVLSRSHLTEIRHPDESILDAVVTNDQVRLDNRPDYVNVSIEHPNIPLLNAYKRRNSLSHVNWCLLALSPELIFHRDTLFAITNAASNRAKKAGISGDISDFRRLFSDTAKPNDSALNSNSKYPVDIQAEVLYQGSIPTGYIDEVIFETDEHQAKTVAALRLLGVPVPKNKVDPRMFKIARL